MNPDRKRPITIEDLIRLKRAERPPTEFWTQFDRELRAKQLAALVAKRPWWHTLPTASIRAFSRFRLPIGAAAVLGLAILTVREPRLQSAKLEIPAVEGEKVAATSMPTDSRGFSSDVVAVGVAELKPVAYSAEPSSAVAAAEEPVETSVIFESGVVPVAPQFAAVGLEPIEVQGSTAPLMSVSLVSATTTSAPNTRLLGAKTGFESRVLPARVSVEPLQQMMSPGETRRARLRNAMVAAVSFETPPRTTERVASRIAEERLYDQVQRFGARGDRLNVKF